VSLLFIVFIGLISIGIDRFIVATSTIILLLLLGVISPHEVLNFVDWDVLGLIIFMNMYSYILEESGFARFVTYKIVSSIKNTRVLLYSLILLSGIVSLILENAVTVFIFAPVALEASIMLGVDPRKILIGIALAAGMSGSATMVGDPPAMIVAGHYNLGFMDFIFYNTRPSMFFLILIPMIIAIASYVYFNFKEIDEKNIDLSKVDLGAVDKLFVYEALVFLLVKIVLLSVRKELGLPLTIPAFIALTCVLATRILVHRDVETARNTIREGLDYKLPVFLISVFLLSNSLKKHGVTDIIASYILSYAGGNPISIAITVFTLSAILSAFIENIPVTLTLLPIIDVVSINLRVDPVILAWAALSGLTAGGGYTYIGSGANVVAIHILESKKIKTTFNSFIKTALPFNIVNTITVLGLYIAIWGPIIFK